MHTLNIRQALVFLLLSIFSLAAQAQIQFNEPDLLQVDQAFPAIITNDDSAVLVNFKVAPAYYLYKHAFEFTANNGVQLGEAVIPKGKEKMDEYFGLIESYRHDLSIRVPITYLPEGTQDFAVTVRSQGCADAGVCYPPFNQEGLIFTDGLDISKIAASASTLAALPDLAEEPLDAQAAVPADEFIIDPSLDMADQPIEDPSIGSPAAADSSITVSEQQALANQLASGKTLLTLASFFGLGLLLAFTPCVFPMIPILAGIIVGQKDQLTTRKAFSLSLVYVLAMALTYTVAGVIVGLSGENVQAAFQTPWVLYVFAAVFVLLSLSMFGLYELQMPSFIQNKLSQASNTQKGGTYIGAAIMGLLSALIVGPCVTAPLIGALIFIADTGDAVLGGLALFCLSMGMGAPLLLIGSTAGKWLPKAGGWMEAVKGFFGVMLLGVAIWLLDRTVSPQITVLLTSLLAIGSAVYMGALQLNLERSNGLAKLKQLASVVLLAYGVIAFIGALSGGKSLLEPLKHFAGAKGAAAQQAHALPFKAIKGVEGLAQALEQAKANKQRVMLDFYADWCVSCKEMESFTFSKEKVQAALKDYVLLQADVTPNDEQDKALLKQLGLIGPPAILFYDPQGIENRAFRVVGFVKAGKFTKHINQHLKTL